MEKIKYSKFKAAEIIKAIKAGKTPSPGGPGDTELLNADQDLELSPTRQVSTEPPVSNQSIVSNVEILDKMNLQEEQDSNISSSGLDYKTIQQAQKFAKFAISALQYDDVNNAIENLTSALNLLQKHITKE